MAINWYPGHMHKANKEMTKILPDVDLVIELLDCRLPYSSQNPAITKLAQNKPCIKILSKSDLADPEMTEQWQDYFERVKSVKTLLTTLDQPETIQRLMSLVRELVPHKSKSRTHVLAMITGIPNVGKSSLINILAGRKVAKTGNEPAITKGLQRIRIQDELILLDTPGILWPKIHNENSGYRLAVSGAIRDTATEVEDLAFYLTAYLLEYHPSLLVDRYNLDAIPKSDVEFLEELGARRGCLRAGGHVDLEKVSSILVNEFRSGTLGRISLETPDMILAEEKIVKAKQDIEAAKQEQKKRNKQSSRGSGKKNQS
ncbi:MAG: ribosome biogenesis GTPase YlqF [Halieaceae bacterium]|nr:ribosome biogenesis GTPase YlqF [Halieaceae bacterium]